MATRLESLAEGSNPFLTIFLTKAHIFGWSFEPRLAMKVDHAFFLDVMIVLIFLASAFLNSSRFVVDIGESLHSLKARRASFTAVLHSSSHHGWAGPLCDALQLGLVLLKNCSLLASRPSVNTVVAVAGSDFDEVMGCEELFQSFVPGRPHFLNNGPGCRTACVVLYTGVQCDDDG